MLSASLNKTFPSFFARCDVFPGFLQFHGDAADTAPLLCVPRERARPGGGRHAPQTRVGGAGLRGGAVVSTGVGRR